MEKVCPCKYCVAPKRFPGCHAVCEAYEIWAKERRQYLDTIQCVKREESDCFPSQLRHPKRRRMI